MTTRRSKVRLQQPELSPAAKQEGGETGGQRITLRYIFASPPFSIESDTVVGELASADQVRSAW